MKSASTVIAELRALLDQRDADPNVNGWREVRIKELQVGFEFRVNAYEGIEGPLDLASAMGRVKALAEEEAPRPPRVEFREVGPWRDVR